MPFQKGNTFGKTRKHHVGGRRPKIITTLKEEIENNPRRASACLNKLYELGMAGDKDCLMYYLDRVWGKPKTINEINQTLVVGTPEDYKRAALMMASDRELSRDLLNPPAPSEPETIIIEQCNNPQDDIIPDIHAQSS